ncbi:E3 ubiquitin-protein ligase RNF25 [Selaginella moellendorffii]|uniref:E3 ubiquitin-protein ligase RNF25 n=1 Tax=Selaginella moellendorffii TaxID=88036 RepID=UPI000D1D0E41|nr:E3 ubiquitin-protein ligase RNF25 [Selaginella moellendorffii]|eukprot:XP_002989843.2 E3 ubiquitin-protein ligase RNF25 [Selaginella moellendorffii]
MEDVSLELEAMDAVYRHDCKILQRWPPHLEVLLKPRTADELPLQFVEIVLSIKAGDKYPSHPPKFELVLVKGLDVSRQINLLTGLELEANRLSNEPMLVTISEFAVDFLTSNNYPEGDCCFCLFPLALDHAHQHYMKLMSCFHCFHSDCFSDWWKWLPADSTASCPVCRAEIHTQDVAHVKEICSRGSTVGVETRGEPDETAVAVVLCEQMPEVSHSTVSTSSDSSEWAQLPVYDTHASHRNKKKHSTHAAKRQWLRKKSGEEFR